MVSWILRGCAIVFSIVMLVAAWNGFAENRDFKKHGQQVRVEPIDGYTETTRTKKKLGVKISESTSHSAEIFFTTVDKRRIKVNRDIPDDVLDAFRTGSDVFVEYLPASPNSARFVGHTPSPLLSALLGLVAIAATVLLWRRM